MFVLSGAGRILRENDPDRSDGPRLALLGCPEGNLAFVRHDVADAEALVRTAEAGPPWFDADKPPACLGELVERLSPAEPVSTSLIFALPHPAPAPDARIVFSDAETGQQLLTDLARDGIPSHLVEAGFVGLADFWAPWCAVVDAGEIAALAFAARLGDSAAEVGVYTFPRWRRRGMAAAATVAWSGMAELAGRELFYSTFAANTSSRGVAARLGLTHVGMGLRIV